jgi:predicted Na+-dependent transporter
MHFVVNLSIPVLVIFMMLVVGLALDTADFRRILKIPVLATAALAAQILSLPLLAVLLVHALRPEATAHNAMTSETAVGG